MQCQWKDKVLAVNGSTFEALALALFRFQYENNNVYKQYTNALKIDPETVQAIEQIPFLPIRFFKSHRIETTIFEPATVFESSGTTGSINSRHFVKDTQLYQEAFTKGFELFYGPVKDWCVLGLLPSYLERENSSLVFMVNELIRLSGHPGSGFYLDDYDKLGSLINELEDRGQKTLLIGVTFALLDFASIYFSGRNGKSLKYATVMETGGMKGRRKEMLRHEVHTILKKAFDLPSIHSEYGMTELLSQAYSSGEGVFRCPPWMKVLIRDEDDPFEIRTPTFQTLASVTGAINIIDLANIYSCSFIATDDAGRLFPDGSFEVLGRIDNSDIRGCSLMVV
jgi:phenylacetate-coenzyme A ligase PaaK-like adenylate-forming protein